MIGLLNVYLVCLVAVCLVGWCAVGFPLRVFSLVVPVRHLSVRCQGEAAVPEEAFF